MWMRCKRSRLLKLITLANIISGMIMVLYYFETNPAIILDSYSWRANQFKKTIIRKVYDSEPMFNEEIGEQTCIIPNFDPYHKDVAMFIRQVSNLRCFGTPPFIEIYKDNILRIKNSKDRSLRSEYVSYCIYWAIERKNNVKNPDDSVNYILRSNSRFETETSINDDFVKVECYNSKNESIYEDYKATILKRPTVEERATKDANKNSGPKLNVLFFGLDSVSRLNSIRHLKKTREFLDKEDVIELKNHNKVGESTLDNMIPVLTGQYIKAYWNESMKSTFDHINLIWHNFSRIGYRTLFAEDAPEIGMFNFEKIGFINPPSDYYFRPFASATENSMRRRRSGAHCFGNNLEMNVPIEWTERFLKKFDNDRYFAWLFISRITHNELNGVGYADPPIASFFERLMEDSNAMNNTVLIFLSDHGIRYGDIRKTYIGRIEYNAPFTFIRFPKWFKSKYPEVWNNLKINENRLTSHFDLHYMLKDILNYPQSLTTERYETERKTPGISLFRRIPKKRNCKDVGVPPNYCACHQYKSIDVKGANATVAAKIIIENVNRITEEYRDKCSSVNLEKILSASLRTNDNDKRYEFYSVNVQVMPKSAEFEGTLKFDPKGSNFELVGDISRINRYYNQSYCVHKKTLKNFCLCK